MIGDEHTLEVADADLTFGADALEAGPLGVEENDGQGSGDEGRAE